MIEASFAVAFLGGILSLLAPCSALLLPAFFAYAFSSRTELLGRTLLFLAGLCTVFIPLGLGASLVAAALLDYRDTTILVAGLLLIGFGVLELLGGGFSLLPAGLASRVRLGQSAAAVYTTGLVYGLAGFCAGPALGAVLTVAGASADPLLGAALLFTYALGTAVPVFLIAWLWDRFDLGRRGWLAGRLVHVGPLHVHTTNLIAGLVFIALGVSFIAFQGGSVLSVLYADLGFDTLELAAQEWVTDYLGRIPNVVWALLALAVVGAGWLWRQRSTTNQPARAADRSTE